MFLHTSSRTTTWSDVKEGFDAWLKTTLILAVEYGHDATIDDRMTMPWNVEKFLYEKHSHPCKKISPVSHSARNSSEYGELAAIKTQNWQKIKKSICPNWKLYLFKSWNVFAGKLSPWVIVRRVTAPSMVGWLRGGGASYRGSESGAPRVIGQHWSWSDITPEHKTDKN